MIPRRASVDRSCEFPSRQQFSDKLPASETSNCKVSTVSEANTVRDGFRTS
jgi:hypothetical protein